MVTVVPRRRVLSNEECMSLALKRAQNSRAAACGRNIAPLIYKRAFQAASQMFGRYGSIKYINPALCNFQLDKSAAHNARTVEERGCEIPRLLSHYTKRQQKEQKIPAAPMWMWTQKRRTPRWVRKRERTHCADNEHISGKRHVQVSWCMGNCRRRSTPRVPAMPNIMYLSRYQRTGAGRENCKKKHRPFVSEGK